MPQTDGAGADAAGDPQTDAATADGTRAPGRVAVVVVHGVADQKAGETAESLVDLLVLSKLRDTRYVAVESREFVIPVVPVPATVPAKSLDEAPDLAAESLLDVGGEFVEETPEFGRRRAGKAFAQSVRSDFQRRGRLPLPTASTLADAARDNLRRALTPEAKPAPDAAAAAPIEPRAENARGPKPMVDRGLQFTQYLMRKANRYGASTESYRFEKTGLERVDAAGHRSRVDVYEMYWADLSRLSGAIPRIVTELFTLIFRLSRLGRDTVDEASRYSTENRVRKRKHWTFLAVTQTFLDWIFVNGLALLFGQLLLMGLFVMAIGAAGDDPMSPYFVALALIAGGLAVLGYLGLAGSSRGAVFALSLGAVLVGLAMLWTPAGIWGLGLVVLALLSIVYRAGLRVAADRFPFVLIAGTAWWWFVVAVMVGALFVRLQGPESLSGSAHLMQVALTGFEWTLGAIKVAWIVFAVPFVLWTFATAFSAAGDNFDGRASAATGRLGLLGSLTMFLMLAMVIWAGLSEPLEWSTRKFDYAPTFWTKDVAPDAACAPAAECEALTNARRFVRERYRKSTETFAIVVLLLLVPMAYIVTTFVPSVLAELKWLTFARNGADPKEDERAIDETLRLGRWLTIGYRLLDPFILLCVLAACVAALGIATLFVFQNTLVAHYPALARFEASVGDFSQNFLKPLVFSAASGFAALSLFGRALSRYVPGLRGPLDAALDVDNYLREFPRRSIPRARIFARYRALLALLKAEGYERIVVVSHSQGTVISAELLRYLSSSDDRLVRSPHRAERLETLLGCKTRLLTMGCPLRQLYAARFPTLYHWILNSDGKAVGPAAADIGVEVWANAFTSGDYVGRWLWSGTPKGRIIYPTTDTVHDAALDRKVAYDRFKPEPPDLPDLAGHAEFETCIGHGAHTHYFEPGQLLVAAIIDHLVADPGPAATPRPSAESSQMGEDRQ